MCAAVTLHNKADKLISGNGEMRSSRKHGGELCLAACSVLLKKKKPFLLVSLLFCNYIVSFGASGFINTHTKKLFQDKSTH